MLHRRSFTLRGWALTGVLVAIPAAAQNSTRKIRPQPGPLAARAGEAVAWREDPVSALAEAKEQDKAVFWYVTSVRGSPMDRKYEIDRYMMAGPFSWPSTVALLNRAFVPVRAVAGGDLQKKYALTREQFIEPGFLILDGDGAELARLDEITTWHPAWFERRIAAAVGAEPGGSALADVWARLDDGPGAVDSMLETAQASDSPEGMFLAGAARWHAGDESQAVAKWAALEAAHPDDPWAWKAAAEREEHGPLVRGFEVHTPLPQGIDAAPARGTQAPKGVYDEAALWERGMRFLLSMQRSNGGFADSRYDFGGTDSLPNVYVATTAIAARAMVAALRRGVEVEGLREALARAVEYLREDAHVAIEDRDEILWAYVYRLRLFADLAARGAGAAATVRADDRDVQRNVDLIQRLQPESGAWFHEYPNPFAIASALSALHAGQEVGATVDGQVVDRGILALLKCRTEEGAYSYGYSPRRARARVEGAAGRMPRCELALELWDRAAEGALRTAVDQALEHHATLDSVRKYDDHANRLGYGGFFFWYDMLGRTEAMVAVGDERAVDAQRAFILELPEIDGVFVDSHELGRVYGTGMALWCLDLLSGVGPK